jgi:hypothetical protein
LTADSVTNPKTVLRLGCFADSDKEFFIMRIDGALKTQCVSKIAVAALVK